MLVIIWQKNGQEFLGDSERIFILEDGRNFIIDKADLLDIVRYICIVRNEVGETDKLFNLEVQGKKVEKVLK